MIQLFATAPAVRGWKVCRMHGARGGAPEGKRNGNYKHGARSKETIELWNLIKSDIVSSMLDLMPAPALVFHEWDSHGSCSGLGARDYFNIVRKARATVKIPPEYTNPEIPLTVSPGEVIDAFVKANEGLARSAISIDCNRTRLREVRICLSRELRFRDCSENSRRTCRSEKLVMPPVRGH